MKSGPDRRRFWSPAAAGLPRTPAGWASVGAGAAAAVFAIAITVTTAEHWAQPSYVMPGSVVAVAAVCAVLTLAGVVVLLRRPGNSPRSWLTVLTALLFLWGFLTIFSVGLGLLLMAAGCLVVRVRRPREWPSGRLTAGVGAGLLLALGLVPLSALAISGPVVACTAQGVETSVPMWIWFGSAGVSGSGASGLGVQGEASPSSGGGGSGRVSVGGHNYTFGCTGDRLTRFSAL
ncbi:MAG: hypothetical protein ACREOD_04235 [Candidatus Dormibacteria bacterium]